MTKCQAELSLIKNISGCLARETHKKIVSLMQLSRDKEK
jgi:hypothetical protein